MWGLATNLAMTEKLLAVQWSYDKRQWYSYGYRTGNKRVVFSTLDEARGILDTLTKTYWARHFRIVDTLGEVVLEKEQQGGQETIRAKL